MKKDKVMGTKRWFYWISIGIVLIIIYKLLDNFTGIGEWISNFFSVLAPFIEGILIAYILYTPCKKLEKFFKKRKNKFLKKHARGTSITIVFILVIALIAWFMTVIIPTIATSISDLISNIQSYYNAVVSDSPDLSITPFIQNNILKPVVDWLQNVDFEALFTVDRIKNYLSSAMGLIRGIINIFIAIICSVYILAQRNRIVRFIDRLSKAVNNEKGYARFNKYFNEGNGIFFRYLSSQMLDGIVVALITSIAMSILGVKYSILLGTLIGFSNLIPYFGAIFGVAIAIIITILTGGWQQALIMGIIVIILQQLDANIINPRITSSSLKVSPLLIMFAVTVGGAYFGVLGMFLAAPIFTLLKVIVDDYVNEKNREKEDAREKAKINLE